MDRIAALVLLVLVPAGSALAASPLEAWQPYVAEASERFGLPENWVRAVIMAESTGDVKAISPKGAMGLMQLTPQTWEDMRTSNALGPDPFDPHANILAGTAYLKAMYDQFGYPALFAAYNAGEGRYEEYLRTGNSLPEETSAYVAVLGRTLGFGEQLLLKATSNSRLFFALSSVGHDGADKISDAPSTDLFIRISGGKANEK